MPRESTAKDDKKDTTPIFLHKNKIWHVKVLKKKEKKLCESTLLFLANWHIFTLQNIWNANFYIHIPRQPQARKKFQNHSVTVISKALYIKKLSIQEMIPLFLKGVR